MADRKIFSYQEFEHDKNLNAFDSFYFLNINTYINIQLCISGESLQNTLHFTRKFKEKL